MVVRITMDKSACAARLKGRFEEKVIPVLSEQVLKDSNFYARMDTGAMIDSSQTASDFKAGKLVWDTPYARKVYYTGSPSKDRNPNASLMWAHTAKNAKNKDWQKLAQKEFSG